MKNRYSMKLLELTVRFPDEELYESHLKQEREQTGVIYSHCGGTHYRYQQPLLQSRNRTKLFLTITKYEKKGIVNRNR